MKKRRMYPFRLTDITEMKADVAQDFGFRDEEIKLGMA